MVEGANRIKTNQPTQFTSQCLQVDDEHCVFRNRQTLLGSGRKVPQNVHSWEKLDENGCLILILINYMALLARPEA